MKNSEALIRSIIGPTRRCVRPLADAVELTVELLFVQGIPMDDIMVSKDIYPIVARRLGKNCSAVTRSIERLANYCWEYGDADRLSHIIGRTLHRLQAPGDMLFYLAFYLHLNLPFYIAIERTPDLLF